MQTLKTQKQGKQLLTLNFNFMKRVKLLFLTVLTVAFTSSCSSDDNEEVKEVPVTNLNQIAGTWTLQDVKKQNGEVLLPDCDRTDSKLVINTSDETLIEYKRIIGIFNDYISCQTSPNIYSYTYTDLSLTSYSNLEAKRVTNQTSGATSTFKFGVNLRGNNLEFYLYQIVHNGGHIETITRDRQIIYHYKKS